MVELSGSRHISSVNTVEPQFLVTSVVQPPRDYNRHGSVLNDCHRKELDNSPTNMITSIFKNTVNNLVQNYHIPQSLQSVMAKQP